MVKSFAIADSYYRDFGRLFSHVSLTNWRVVVTSLSGAAFVAVLLHIFLDITGGITIVDLSLLGVAELFFIFFHASLISFKNKNIISSYNSKNSKNISSLELVKIEAIQNLLDCNQNEFFGEAKKLDEIINLSNKYRSPFDFSVQSLSDWV
jgi:hypothetical protein